MTQYIDEYILLRFKNKQLHNICHTHILSFLFSYFLWISVVNILIAMNIFLISQKLMICIIINFADDEYIFYNFLLNNHDYFDICCLYIFSICIIYIFNVRSSHVFSISSLYVIFDIFTHHIAKIIFNLFNK
jgi:hypothetical protein